jgi:hypothetical protein
MDREQDLVFEKSWTKQQFLDTFNFLENPKGKSQLKKDFKEVSKKAGSKKVSFRDILDFYFEGKGKKIEKLLEATDGEKMLSNFGSGEQGASEKVLKVMVLNDFVAKMQKEVEALESERNLAIEDL